MPNTRQFRTDFSEPKLWHESPCFRHFLNPAARIVSGRSKEPSSVIRPDEQALQVRVHRRAHTSLLARSKAANEDGCFGRLRARPRLGNMLPPDGRRPFEDAVSVAGQSPPRLIYLTCRNSSMPSTEPSRPIPLSLTPPKGATSVVMIPSLIPTMPDSMARPTRNARARSRV
jgi:hypothetical protein